MKCSKRSFVLFAVLGMLSVNAYATPPGNTGTVCNGSGSCGDSSNNNPGNNYANSSSVSQGVGVGIGVGVGGASASNSSSTATNGSVTSDIENSNVNNNASSAQTNVNVEGDSFKQRRIPVATAYAPSIAPSATCALSVQGGIQFVGFGGSFGNAYIDKNCQLLEKVRMVSGVLGDIELAEQMLCEDKAYAKAREDLGRACVFARK